MQACQVCGRWLRGTDARCGRCGTTVDPTTGAPIALAPSKAEQAPTWGAPPTSTPTWEPQPTPSWGGPADPSAAPAPPAPPAPPGGAAPPPYGWSGSPGQQGPWGAPPGPRPPRSGAGTVLLVLGLVGGGLLAVVVVCVVAVTLLGTPQGGRVRGQPRELEHTLPWSAMTTLSVGDCLAVEVGGEEPEQLAETVPQSCDQPHRSEVFAQEQLVGSTFPGDEAVRAAVADLCWGQGFYDYVGLPYQDSSLWQTSYFPTEQNWNEGARLITCIVHGPDPASPTLGSYRDARV